MISLYVYNTWARSLRWVKCCTMLWVLLVFNGCANLQTPRPQEPESIYTLGETVAMPRAFDANGPSILISAPTAAAGYRNANMIYVQQAHRLDQFALHRWADAPATMLHPLLVSAAEGSGKFRAVATPGNLVDVDLRLDATVLYLHQDFRQKPSVVELALRVTLIERSHANILASDVIRLRETADEDTPYGGVKAANRAVAQMVQQLHGYFTQQISR